MSDLQKPFDFPHQTEDGKKGQPLIDNAVRGRLDGW
jgi:hypothetical protein